MHYLTYLKEEKMRKIILFLGFVLIGLLVVSSTSVPLQAAIPASERAALIALYNATNGASWGYNYGWKGNNNESDGFSQIGSEGSWSGIWVSGDHVTLIGLSFNSLSGRIPPELGNLSKLEYLWLDYNQLNGNIPEELGNLTNLEVLSLIENNLSGSIPTELGNLTNLEVFSLSENNLSGSIPAELGNLSELQELGLDDNHLNGNIPPQLGNLSNLEHLWIGYNQLSSSIPPELGNLSNLYRLDLRKNQLSGSIPEELGNLSNLERLELDSNLLTGSIPTELGYLSNLWMLDLSSNKLSGNIPSSLTNLTNLWWLDISHNCLYTNDPDLRAWLNSFDPDWESYQCEGEKDPPFGSFDTPIDGSTVCSSIPVTGWALDDTGIDSIKIYREQGNGLVYIGDATFVEGARPDIAALYPGYPNNTKAGWGYMMLTNFLPNSGNGTFVIHAIATDVVGKTTTLGTKTIHCDNANAVKPFGAIDTPTQGGTASGSSFVNWGWVLTPQPNYIPTDGSTIRVFVDSVELGHPTYNIYREDIATFFPGCANSNGAIGYFSLDTTAYENGVHTIFWTAEDNAGNTDGIGSRYFSIQNSHRAGSTAHGVGLPSPGVVPNVSNIPIDYSIPVRVKKGFKEDIEPQEVLSDENGVNRIVIKELERIEVYLSLFDQPFNGCSYSGYMKVGNRLDPLPVGSTLNAQKGIFYWQPGPGFIGDYQLLFIVKEPGGDIIRKNMLITIIPKFTIER